MSDTSSLTELARFVGRSSMTSLSGVDVANAAGGLAGRLVQRPSRQRVSDLLAVVLTLSARTRRMVLPKVEIDLDVFAPGGERAVRVLLPQ
jgi:hypothetical protein